MTGVEGSIEKFIKDELLQKDSSIHLTPEFPLLEGGVIDSVSLQRLVGFVEDEFDIIITDQFMEPASFSSISAISNLVNKIQEAGS